MEAGTTTLGVVSLGILIYFAMYVLCCRKRPEEPPADEYV
jgi:hypothetical protein